MVLGQQAKAKRWKTRRLSRTVSRINPSKDPRVELLGVVIDTKMSWEHHMKTGTVKLSRVIIYILCKLRGRSLSDFSLQYTMMPSSTVTWHNTVYSSEAMRWAVTDLCYSQKGWKNNNILKNTWTLTIVNLDSQQSICLRLFVARQNPWKWIHHKR